MNTVEIDNHIIRRAQQDDIPNIMEFLNIHWEEGCLLARDRAYFYYDYVVDNQVNMVIAEHKDTHMVDGIVGFLQTSKREIPDGFTSMWIVNARSGTPFLGLSLLENVRKLLPIRRIAGTSLRVNTSVPLIKAFFSSTPYKMRHYYRLMDREDYRVAKISRKLIPPGEKSGMRLVPLPTMAHVHKAMDLTLLPDWGIYKDGWYLEHRYFTHPYYTFNVFGIEPVPGTCTAILVCKLVQANGGKAFRIMDLFGTGRNLPGIANELDIIMRANDFEYTDFYCLGISPAFIEKCGFVQRTEDDPNVIPNYFEPFVQENIDIWVNSPWIGKPGMRLFRGDGDLSRPKRLRLPEEWLPS